MDRKACSKCGCDQPLENFAWLARQGQGRKPRFDSWCRECRRIGVAEFRRRHPERYRQLRAAYLARPEVQSRERERKRRFWARRDRRAWQKRYRLSPRGRVMECLHRTVSLLRRAGPDEDRIIKLLRRLRECGLKLKQINKEKLR